MGTVITRVAMVMICRPRRCIPNKPPCGIDSCFERQEERTQFSGSRCAGAHGLTLVKFLHMSHLKSDEMHVSFYLVFFDNEVIVAAQLQFATEMHALIR